MKIFVLFVSLQQAVDLSKPHDGMKPKTHANFKDKRDAKYTVDVDCMLKGKFGDNFMLTNQLNESFLDFKRMLLRELLFHQVSG